MADELVGTWTMDANKSGSKDYFDCIGKSDEFSQNNIKSVLVVTKTKDNEYKMVTSAKGWAEDVEEIFTIGQKCKHFYPGFGYAETDVYLEGNRLVREGNPEGTPLKSVIYAEDNTFMTETTIGNKTVIVRLQKS